MKWKEKDDCRWAWWVWKAAEGTFEADFGVAQRPQGWCWLHCHSVAKTCLTLCDPMDCSTPGFPILHHLPEPAQTRVHWVRDAIQPSHPTVLFPSCHQSFPVSGSFPVSWLFTSGGQTIGTSASASVLLLQEGGPLPGLETGLLSNTRKWIVQGDTCWQSKRFYWERAPGWRAVGKGTQENFSAGRGSKSWVLWWWD